MTLVAFVLLGLVLYFERDVIGETWDLLATIDARYLLLLPLFQATSYLFIALYYRSFLSSFNKKVRFSRLYGMVFALSFVNQILPSGGLSGVTYIIYGLRRKVSTGLATLMQLGRYIFNYISYFFILLVALGFLIFGGTVASLVYGIMISMVISLIVGIGTLLYALASKKRVDVLIGSLGRFIDWIARKFRSGKPLFGRDKIQSTLTEFHDGYTAFRERGTHIVRLEMFMLMSSVFDVAIVITSFYIVGADVNPGYIMVAFAIANAAGVISVIPGDVGVHEGAIIAVLAFAGVPASVAVSGTLLYRVFNKLVFLPFGFYFYSKLLKPAQAVAS